MGRERTGMCVCVKLKAVSKESVQGSGEEGKENTVAEGTEGNRKAIIPVFEAEEERRVRGLGEVR